MALIRCGNMKNFFESFNGLNYITTGLNIFSGRVTILDGGYCVKDGLCYVKLKLKSNYNFPASFYVAIKDFPTVNDTANVIISSTEKLPTEVNDSIFKTNCEMNPSTSSSNKNLLQLRNIPNNTEFWAYSIYSTT